MNKNTLTQNEITTKILAQTLFELSPTLNLDEWEDYIRKNGKDPKAFFASNGEGLEEYNRFVKLYDKDKHARNIKTMYAR